MELLVKAQYKTGAHKKDPSKSYEAVAFEAEDENGKVYKAFVFAPGSGLDDVKPVKFGARA